MHKVSNQTSTRRTASPEKSAACHAACERAKLAVDLLQSWACSADEHGAGDGGPPFHPVPWSDDGSHKYPLHPSETVERLRSAGFDRIELTETGEKYLQAFRNIMAVAEKGELP